MRHTYFLFDLDGTLLNTLPDLHASTNFALRAHHLPERTYEEVQQFVGNGIRRLMQRAAGEEHFSEALFETFRTHYAAHCTEQTRPYEGIPALLQTLKARGARLGVISNKFDAAVQQIIAHYFPGTFSAVAGEGPITPRKPDPTGTLRVLREMGWKEGEEARVLYVGDSEVDAATARAAGLPLCLVLWGFRPASALRALQCTMHNAQCTIVGAPSDILLFSEH